jgi:pimeloyl-ACP methyl ester carboxylesterase
MNTSSCDIGGRKLAFNCTGVGSPTVVLETGLGAESSEWQAVQQAIDPRTRVLRYDRAARGASDRAPGPRVASDMVADLRTLLKLEDIPGPYVLVGHSFGGLLMRWFALHHRDEVQALILVDSIHASQFDVFGPLFPPPVPSEARELTGMRRFWTGGWRSPDSTTENIDFMASLQEDRAIGGLGDLPIKVLTAGTFANSKLIPAQVAPELQRRWEDLQRTFLGLSTNAEQSFIRGSGHFMQRDDPGAIIEAIVTGLSLTGS